ncbi:hypothetical protein HNQ77_001453 [Silvibacterium bohemicum]|uniref:Uncharacterized protein n=1 Tax=Silvibacterium bohemicum TaxID=1577686 RepID=A0A841JUT1_9BACT|nr:hypothetical protein [Silvibacterium bohemicum]
MHGVFTRLCCRAGLKENCRSFDSLRSLRMTIFEKEPKGINIAQQPLLDALQNRDRVSLEYLF